MGLPVKSADSKAAEAPKQRRRDRLRAALIACLVGCLAGLGLGASPALAAYVTTTYQTLFTVSSTCHVGRATLSTNGGTAYGTATAYTRPTSCTGSKTVPAGYLAAQAITERGGVVCRNVKSPYNTSAVSNRTASAIQNCGSGNYRARAGVWGYNTSTGFYIVQYTTNTPIAAL